MSDRAVELWNELGDMLRSPRGRVSSDLVKDGYSITFKDRTENDYPIKITLTRPTFQEACAAMIAAVREAKS